MTSKIRVAVVDDHPLMREGVVHTINSDCAFEVVGEGASAADAVALAQEHTPDLILLDVSMPGGGIEAAIRIGQIDPAIKVVMLTVSEDERNVNEALMSGAKGYILKGVGGAELIQCVKSICSGDGYVSPNLAARLLIETKMPGASFPSTQSATASALEKLTFREDQILQFVADGKSNKQIGELLELSEQTIKHYVSAIFQKLDVKNRVEATLVARRLK